MVPSDQGVAPAQEQDVARRGTPLQTAVRATAPTGGSAGLVLVGAACGPPTLVICAVLAAVVMLAGLAIPQHSEDRLHLWLALFTPKHQPPAGERGGDDHGVQDQRSRGEAEERSAITAPSQRAQSANRRSP